MLSRALELKRDQILVLIAKDFKLKYNSTALGFLWSLLVPIFSSIIYYFVFGVLLRFHIPNYLLYLLSGNFFVAVLCSCGNDEWESHIKQFATSEKDFI